METTAENDVDQVVEAFKQGRLTEQSLRQALERPGAAAKHQDLLYLQASSTSVVSSVVGMSMVCAGEVIEGPAAPEKWPYQTVLAAIRDGWRVVKFPELALLLIGEGTVGLGCEFILEKWS
jgi:hypothetical protein